jgi:hypothetical protein
VGNRNVKKNLKRGGFSRTPSVASLPDDESKRRVEDFLSVNFAANFTGQDLTREYEALVTVEAIAVSVIVGLAEISLIDAAIA